MPRAPRVVHEAEILEDLDPDVRRGDCEVAVQGCLGQDVLQLHVALRRAIDLQRHYEAEILKGLDPDVRHEDCDVAVQGGLGPDVPQRHVAPHHRAVDLQRHNKAEIQADLDANICN